MSHEESMDTSTPIQNHGDDKTEFTPIAVSISTPNETRRGRLPSILKNSPHKQLFDPSSPYYSGGDDQSSRMLTPSRTKVIFLPTKEIVSFGNDVEGDYTVDLTRLEEEPERKPAKPSESPWTRMMTDPSVPYVLLLYLQLLVNLLLVSVVLYLCYLLISTVRADINHKVELYTTDALQEISRCSREFYRNKCSTENGNKRAPALEQTCTNWEKCMNRDPQLIGKSKITAETFGEILNGFLAPLSWKSLFLANIVLFGSFVVTNMAFGSYRSGSGHQIYADRQRLKALEKKLQEKEKEALRAELQYVTPAHFLAEYRMVEKAAS